MIKKKYGLLIAPVLMLGLAACNNDNDNKAPMDTAYNRTDVNTPLNVRNDVIDHRGPLTEDYDLGRNRYNTMRTVRDNDRLDRDNEFDLTRTSKRRGDDLDISNMNTNLNSNQYPHTRAVLIQDAKYKFIRMDPNQAKQFLSTLPPGTVPPGMLDQLMPAPGQQQAQQPRATAPAPVPKTTAPTPKTTAPTPAAPAPKGTTPAPAPTAPTAKATAGISQMAQQVIDLTNAERRKNGLPALIGDAKLSGVAQKKSEDMRIKGYFSHTSPTYGSPFDMMRDFGISYNSAGENIAQGQTSAQQVVTAWMNSEGHRKNILSPNFTHIGVGYDSSGHHWTQMFIGK